MTNVGLAVVLACVVIPAAGHGAPRTKAEPLDTVFRARNPQVWSTVALGPRGLVNHLIGSDPAFQIRTLDKDGHYQWDEAALERVRVLLRSNADLFGIDTTDADHVLTANGAVGYYDNDTGFLLVAIKLEPVEPAGIDIAIQPRIRMTPTVTSDDVARRFIGHRYVVRTVQTMPAPIDCRMGGLGDGACRARTIIDTRRIALAAGDFEVTQGMIRFAGAQRLVHCVDLGQTSRRALRDVDEAAHPASIQLRPSDGGPTVPFLIDAVTGKRLPVTATTCNEIWLRFVK